MILINFINLSMKNNNAFEIAEGILEYIEFLIEDRLKQNYFNYRLKINKKDENEDEETTEDEVKEDDDEKDDDVV